LSFTKNASENLNIQRDLELCIQQKYLFEEYLPDLIQATKFELTKENLFIFVGNPDFKADNAQPG
jgi:hypothetical protein